MNTIPASITTGRAPQERKVSAWQLIWFAGDDSWAVERGVDWDAADQSWRRLERLAAGVYEDCWRAMVSELGRRPVLVDAEPDMWCAFPHRAWQVQ